MSTILHHIYAGVYIYACSKLLGEHGLHCLTLPEGVTKVLTKEVTFALSLKGLGVSREAVGYLYQRKKPAQHMHTMKKSYAQRNIRDPV